VGRVTSRAQGLRLLAAGAALLAGAGCTSSAPRAAPPVTPAAAVTPTASCPVPAGSLLAWPAGVPLDLPIPPGATPGSSSVQPGGITVVRFSTADSLRDGVLHLVSTLGPAGFTLGRGDAEAGEADAPFTRGDLRGVYRMTAREPCRTDWVLAVTVAPDAGVPLLPTPTGSPSPLPFG
jgi:hypothetical protein